MASKRKKAPKTQTVPVEEADAGASAEKTGNPPGRPVKALGITLILSDVPRARRSWCRLVRAYEQGLVPSERFRDMGMAFRTLLDYLKDEREVAFSARLDEVEKLVEGLVEKRGGIRLAK